MITETITQKEMHWMHLYKISTMINYSEVDIFGISSDSSNLVKYV